MDVHPPAELDTSFFDWLETMIEELAVRFVDRGSLSASEIDELERESGERIPEQIRVYYENCTPWGRWREPRSVWKMVQENITSVIEFAEPILPIDINSEQGNDTIARLFGGGAYEIVEVRWRDGSVQIHEGDPRSYLVKVVEDEIRRSS